MTQINLAAKTAVQKVKPDNIRRAVLGMNLSKIVSESTMERMGIDANNTFSKPPYAKELERIIQKLNEKVGTTWASIKAKKVLHTIDGATIPLNEYPWSRIRAAVGEFPAWMDQHSQIMNIDHTFVKESMDTSMFD